MFRFFFAHAPIGTIFKLHLKTTNMKHLITTALLAVCAISFATAQDGPKSEKKEDKMVKKEDKMLHKAIKGQERKAVKKEEKAVKKEDKMEMKADRGK